MDSATHTCQVSRYTEYRQPSAQHLRVAVRHQSAGCFSAAVYRPHSHDKQCVSGPATGQAPEVAHPLTDGLHHIPTGRELGEGPEFSHTTHLALIERFIELRTCVSFTCVCVYQFVCAHMYIGRACSLDKYLSIQGKTFFSSVRELQHS